MKVAESKRTCGICDETKSKGIYLYNLFVCNECEQKMVHTEPNEEQYQYYVDKLKNMNQPTLYS
ncbi:sigma factor G inhibitor Gin [Aquibacillus sediminis]|uniref:sigma factor G inhibitor Gin n=1 Tax=Aquibacillus sediminis TaxID=2574734 RepID=UPI001109941E|nr:sigma factor G inhibitor Gin [Aquibacillus sediminis]